MKRNPLIPFALIAALGIIVMFVFSFQGLNKSKELADAKNGRDQSQLLTYLNGGTAKTKATGTKKEKEKKKAKENINKETQKRQN